MLKYFVADHRLTLRYASIPSARIFVLRSTDNTIPIPAMYMAREVEPKLINGSGNPVGGIDPVTTAMLMALWMKMSDAIPKHTYREKRSDDASPI